MKKTAEKSVKTTTGKYRIKHRRTSLVIYDILLLFLTNILILILYPNPHERLGTLAMLSHLLLSAGCIFLFRYLLAVYRQVWRYGGTGAYIRIIMADAAAGISYYILHVILPVQRIEFFRAFALVATNLLLSMSVRLVYSFLYEYARRRPHLHGPFWRVIDFLSGLRLSGDGPSSVPVKAETKIKVAIVGAGRVGVMLADELLNNPHASYTPCCFIDIDRTKIGREIYGIPVLSEEEATDEKLASFPVQEIVFALPQVSIERKKELYRIYKQTGCKLKVYDFPLMQTAGNSKRHMREFDIEELLFRQPVEFHNDSTNAYYTNKVILITGGGGSIGSELCRQIARMSPKCLIILDVYENGAYEIQQELRIRYGNSLNLHVEILTVCDRRELEKVFATYHPQIVLHAAAHKHVPLMEHNCCEAVKNNVFGTLNVVELAEKYNAERFMMVSTDKAVNPTNVMGATKRMCEMIVQSHSRSGSQTVFTATRFGNVLGSAGSVIPLFKKQIMNGGPVTLTDKRIIRYFMTIPEASQLVLQSGSMAKNGELFVLDMGKPVRILELAENMIRLSGYEPYKDIDIIETGLRPGEKLYEELLIRSEELDKTENSMIFIERDTPLPLAHIRDKLDILRGALETGDDETVREALMEVVPTFRRPEDVNRIAGNAQEMKLVEEHVGDKTSVLEPVV